MNYTECITYLYSSQPVFHQVGAKAYKPGLDNTMALMKQLGEPHKQFRSIHIAGTNGKGSTSHLMAASLQAAGLRVGLYTSPHLIDFRERIRINGKMIPEETVVAFVEEHKSFLEELKPSFFETTMAMAFAYFAAEKVDVAVVETGLGGRLDSTNIITPMLSVITNIGFDHMEFLGNTLAQIAAEKAGIIKKGVPCVVGETDPETLPIFMDRAMTCGILGEGLETTDCRLWFADQSGFMRKRRLREVPECQLHGIYQEKNQQTAYVALRVLQQYSEVGERITTDAIREGFAQVCSLTGLRGRWEVLQEKPLTICDTGHNAHGLRYVSEQLTTLQKEQGGRLLVIFGMVSDKDVERVLSLLPTNRIEDGIEYEVRYYFVEANTQRAIPAETLLMMWREVHANDNHSVAKKDISTAWEAVRAEACDKDVLFIGGSNYVVGDFLKMF